MAVVNESEIIGGVYVVDLVEFADARGKFVETFRRQWIPGGREMLQANRGDRQAGSIVGLHYHLHQADYWYVPKGRARAVLHDLRTGSPTDGATQMIEMSDDIEQGLFIPPGVAHGFSSITDVQINYLVDSYYNPADELGVAWDDPAIGADWGLTSPILSERDASNPKRDALDPQWQPHYSLRT